MSCKGYNSFKKAAVCVGVGDSLKNPHTWIFSLQKSRTDLFSDHNQLQKRAWWPRQTWRLVMR